MTHVYVTKYAFTRGILKCELVAEDSDSDGGSKMITVRWLGGLNGVAYFHGEGVQWHRDLPAAKNNVAKMARAKLKSIEKQRSKLLEIVKNGGPITNGM